MSDKEARKYLYSPWRLDYILGEKPGDCVLCRYQNLGADKENLILWRSQYSYVMLNRYPYNNGHLMIVPYQHRSSLQELDKGTWEDMCSLIRSTELVLQRVYHCEGINIGLNTRMYFPEDGALHAADPVLSMVEQQHRRATLIATATAPGRGAP